MDLKLLQGFSRRDFLLAGGTGVFLGTAGVSRLGAQGEVEGGRGGYIRTARAGFN